MNTYVGVLILIGLLVVGWRFMRPRQPRNESAEGPRLPQRKIEGFQVWSPLHIKMGRSCVNDHGMQFGPGFRRKEGPVLPHDPECRCETNPFTFTSSEVFAGALRRISEPTTLQPGFPATAIPAMIAALKRINAEPVPQELDAYIALADPGVFDAADQPAAIAFLKERHAFLTRDPGVLPVSDTSTDMPEDAPSAAQAPKTP